MWQSCSVARHQERMGSTGKGSGIIWAVLVRILLQSHMEVRDSAWGLTDKHCDLNNCQYTENRNYPWYSCLVTWGVSVILLYSRQIIKDIPGGYWPLPRLIIVTRFWSIYLCCLQMMRFCWLYPTVTFGMQWGCWQRWSGLTFYSMRPWFSAQNSGFSPSAPSKLCW